MVHLWFVHGIMLIGHPGADARFLGIVKVHRQKPRNCECAQDPGQTFPPSIPSLWNWPTAITTQFIPSGSVCAILFNYSDFWCVAKSKYIRKTALSPAHPHESTHQIHTTHTHIPSRVWFLVSTLRNVHHTEHSNSTPPSPCNYTSLLPFP